VSPSGALNYLSCANPPLCKSSNGRVGIQTAGAGSIPDAGNPQTTRYEKVSIYTLDDGELKEILSDLLSELGFEIVKEFYSQPVLRKKEKSND